MAETNWTAGKGTTALSIIGTSLGGLAAAGGGNLLGGLFGNGNGLSHYDLEVVKEIANKDMEIAYWRGQDETNKKISDSFAVLRGEITELAREVRHNKEEQYGINMQQAVYNGTNTATIQCMRGQIDELLAITVRKVPNTSVCPGWGEITVAPVAAAAAGA